MKERGHGQNTAAVILIGIGVVFLASQVLGFSIFDVVGSVFGSVFGALGTALGSVMGAIGTVIGSVMGAIGSALGSVFGAIGTVIGSIFGTVGSIADIGWPFFIILPGLAFLAVAFFGPVSVAALAVPGALVTGTGLILLFQDMTGRFDTWAYLWALYPAFVGAALMFLGTRVGNRSAVEGGRKAVTVGLLMTAGLGLLFELIFSGGFGLIWRFGVPAALIVGGYLLLRKRDAAPATGKRKHELAYAAPLPEKPKNNGKYGISPELERQINEALAEDDPNEPLV